MARAPRNLTPPDVSGWGYTIGWSKRQHFFRDGQAVCNGSVSDGNVTVKRPASGSACPDCDKHLAGKRRDPNRAQTGGRPMAMAK